MLTNGYVIYRSNSLDIGILLIPQNPNPQIELSRSATPEYWHFNLPERLYTPKLVISHLLPQIVSATTHYVATLYNGDKPYARLTMVKYVPRKKIESLISLLNEITNGRVIQEEEAA